MNLLDELVLWYETAKVESTLQISIAIFIIIVTYILSSILAYGIIKLFTIKSKNKKVNKNPFYKPLKLLLIFTGVYIAISILKLPTPIMNVINKTFKIIIIILVSNGIGNIVKPNSILFEKLKNSERYKDNKAVLMITSKLIRSVVYTFAFFIILYELGYDLNGLVTGLGLGSVVIALAAQDIVKSLLAGAVIFTDKPFEIGDSIEIKNKVGTVENIKFRTTRVRLLDGSLLNVPNELLMTETTTNWTKIKKRRYTLNLELMLDTKMEKVNRVINIIKKELEKLEGTIDGSVQVHFDLITENGMNLLVYLETRKTAYVDFLQFKQEVNLLIMTILEKENVSLAYKSQDIYIRK